MSESESRNKRLMESLVLSALASKKAKNERQALSFLNQALLMAEPEGFVSVFIDQGPMIAELLMALTKNPYHYKKVCPPTYIRKLKEIQSSQDDTKALDWKYRIDPLSKRDLEVLHHLAQGLSNIEIAETLFISVGTVKTHIHKIISKLEAGSRSKAAVKAKEMGLIA